MASRANKEQNLQWAMDKQLRERAGAVVALQTPGVRGRDRLQRLAQEAAATYGSAQNAVEMAYGRQPTPVQPKAK
jgi:hypothetical protein